MKFYLNQTLSFFKQLEDFAGSLSRQRKRLILTNIDIFLFLISIYCAFSFRLGWVISFDQLLSNYFWLITTLLVVIKVVVFQLVGVYRPVLRYTGWEFMITAIKSVFISSGSLVLLAYLFRIDQLPRSVLLNDAFLTLVLLIFVRWSITSFLTQIRLINQAEKKPLRVIIYGAGNAGSLLAQSLLREDGYQPVGFIDDHLPLCGQIVQGLTVYSTDDLYQLQEKIAFDAILLAMPSIKGERRQKILHKLQQYSIPVKTIPSISEILSGSNSINKIRDIDIGDLLGREQVIPSPKLLQQDIRDKVVIVTGAGGSIGSEICRQIASQEPKLLILFELNEFALYQLDLELSESHPELDKISYLGSINDGDLLRKIFTKFHVETVYHAAAYKHVPLVEANPLAGMNNNIFGTLTTAQAAIACDVKKFVLISTDKAVRPTNIMGSTKRVAELILQGLANQPNTKTCFTMVRFGNVLGSSGSVVPRFRQQIVQGKPITLTHPEITRYFMSIPEAASLVIQAGAMATGGEVFLLDMGEPVKIYDLAAQMIELHGLEIGKDIQIEITGLRPGEKIYEELLIDCDRAQPTKHPKIFCAQEVKLPWSQLEIKLKHLRSAIANNQVNDSLILLKSLVPEYQPDGKYAKLLNEQTETFNLIKVQEV